MFAALWGAFMISIFVVSFSSLFELDNNQQKALRHIKLSRSAAKTIKHAMQYFIAKKRFYK